VRWEFILETEGRYKYGMIPAQYVPLLVFIKVMRLRVAVNLPHAGKVVRRGLIMTEGSEARLAAPTTATAGDMGKSGGEQGYNML